jgi:hypothetical protein
VSLVVLLDAGPLGMITNPKSSLENQACKDWLANLVSSGVGVVIPEISDYEVRRELLGAGKFQGIGRLDALKGILHYAPINYVGNVESGGVLGECPKDGRQSADDASLDADMILAAQSQTLAGEGDQPVIATTNVRHLAVFASTRIWRDIG